MLRENFRRLSESGIELLFTRLRPPILKTFQRSHLFNVIPRDRFHRKPANAYAHARQLIG